MTQDGSRIFGTTGMVIEVVGLSLCGRSAHCCAAVKGLTLRKVVGWKEGRVGCWHS